MLKGHKLFNSRKLQFKIYSKTFFSLINNPHKRYKTNETIINQRWELNSQNVWSETPLLLYWVLPKWVRTYIVGRVSEQNSSVCKCMSQNKDSSINLEFRYKGECNVYEFWTSVD